MLPHGSILVSLLGLVEQLPTPPPPVKRQRGRQECYSDTLFVKALRVMIIRRLSPPLPCCAFWSRTTRCPPASSLADGAWTFSHRDAPGNGALPPCRRGCQGSVDVWVVIWSRCGSRGHPGPRPPSIAPPWVPPAASGTRHLAWAERPA